MARRGLCIANGFSSIVADENDNSDDEDIRCAPISLVEVLGQNEIDI